MNGVASHIQPTRVFFFTLALQMFMKRVFPILQFVRHFNQENFSKTTPVFLKDIAKSVLLIENYSKVGIVR